MYMKLKAMPRAGHVSAERYFFSDDVANRNWLLGHPLFEKLSLQVKPQYQHELLMACLCMVGESPVAFESALFQEAAKAIVKKDQSTLRTEMRALRTFISVANNNRPELLNNATYTATVSGALVLAKTLIEKTDESVLSIFKRNITRTDIYEQPFMMRVIQAIPREHNSAQSAMYMALLAGEDFPRIEVESLVFETTMASLKQLPREAFVPWFQSLRRLLDTINSTAPQLINNSSFCETLAHVFSLLPLAQTMDQLIAILSNKNTSAVQVDAFLSDARLAKVFIAINAAKLSASDKVALAELCWNVVLDTMHAPALITNKGLCAELLTTLAEIIEYAPKVANPVISHAFYYDKKGAHWQKGFVGLTAEIGQDTDYYLYISMKLRTYLHNIAYNKFVAETVSKKQILQENRHELENKRRNLLRNARDVRRASDWNTAVRLPSLRQQLTEAELQSASPGELKRLTTEIAEHEFAQEKRKEHFKTEYQQIKNTSRALKRVTFELEQLKIFERENIHPNSPLDILLVGLTPIHSILYLKNSTKIGLARNWQEAVPVV